MNTYAISYLDNEGKKQSTKLDCYSHGSARLTFNKEFKGQFTKVESILSLGKAKTDQVSVGAESNPSFDTQKGIDKTINNNEPPPPSSCL